MLNRFPIRQRCGLLLLCAALTLGGCASLPSSGPTANEIVKLRDRDDHGLTFKVIPIDQSIVTELNRVDSKMQASEQTLSTLAVDRRADLIGPGDVLAINIYEVGVTLFSGGGASASLSSAGLKPGGGFEPSAHSESFPAITVDARGQISLPYLGPLTVAGLTPVEVEHLIERGFHGKSQDPRALVEIRQNVTNTVYVSGEVRKPGRFDLTLEHERLLDAVASTGGSVNSPEDTVIRFVRGGRSVEQRLATIRSGSSDDLTLNPGDRVELIKRPRTYLVFGASNRVSEVSFEKSGVTLAEAVARVGGPSDFTADPSAILLFRYATAVDGEAVDQPVIYRLNMLDPASYFLAQRVAMRDKDVIYVANARANKPTKFVSILEQLFAPAVAVRQLAP